MKSGKSPLPTKLQPTVEQDYPAMERTLRARQVRETLGQRGRACMVATELCTFEAIWSYAEART